MGNKKSSFPVPTGWTGSDKLFAESVKENVDVLTGTRGDPLDRAITARDLISSGIATLPKGANFYTGAADGLAPKTGEEILDTVPPPTNLAANGAFENILLTWDLKAYVGHAFVQVYRHTSDDIANATLLGQVSGFTGVYSDQVGEDAEYWYWVRAVNTNGDTGSFNTHIGTRGTTQSDVSYLLSVLSNSITTSELATSLQTPINSIGDIQDDVTAIEGAIDNLKNTPAWASGTAYVVGDLVSYSGSGSTNHLYSALTAHTSTADDAPDQPQDPAYWQHIGAYGSIIDVLAESENTRATLISDYITTVDSDSAIAGAKTELRSAFYGDALGLSDWDSSTTYTYSASTNVRVVYEDKIYELKQTSTNDQPDNSPTYWSEDLVQSESSIKQKHYTKADANSAIATQIDTLSSAFFNDVFDLDEWDSSTAYTYSETALTQVYYNNIIYKLLQTSTNDQPDNSPTYWEESALASDAKLNFNHYTKAGTDGAISGAITTATSGLANPDGSNSTVTLQQAMTTQADVNDGLKGQYTVKIDADGHVAGFGLANTSTSAGASTSEFFINADKFAILPAPMPFTSAPELVVNGTFASNVDNWTAVEGSVSYLIGMALLIENDNQPAYAYQGITTEIGETYRVTGNIINGSCDGAISVSTSASPYSTLASSPTATGNASVDFEFTAVGTTTYVILEARNSSSGNALTFDNISVKQISTPEWSFGTVYAVGDQVKYTPSGGTEHIYVAKIAHTAGASSNPTGTYYWKQIDVVPFSVLRVPTTVNGTVVPAGVYIDSAHISDGSITTAHIENATMDMANVTGTLSANKIEGGTITTSLLNLDSNVLTQNISGELILQTADTNNQARGVKFENLSYDAVGVLDMVLAGYVACANQTASFANFESALPYHTYSNATLPTLLEMNVPASALKESGSYILEFGASPMGSFGDTDQCALVYSVYYDSSGGTNYSALAYYGASSLGIGHFAPRNIHKSLHLYDHVSYQFRTYGYLKGVDLINGNRGFDNNFMKIIKLHKTT